jgi:hypothetical protein
VAVLTCFVLCGVCICGFSNVWVFCNMLTGIYCVLYFFVYVYILLFMLLFNFVSYVLLLLFLYILTVMYVLFYIVCFHRVNWHSQATLADIFSVLFVSCKANSRV